MFVGPDIASTGVPLMRTVLPTAPFEGGGIGIFVAEGTAKNGVLLIIVKLPETPGGKFARGRFVGPEIARFGFPSSKIVLPTFGVGLACGIGRFVALGTII